MHQAAAGDRRQQRSTEGRIRSGQLPGTGEPFDCAIGLQRTDQRGIGEAGAFQRRGDHRFGKHMFIGGRVDLPGTFQQQFQPCTGHAHARDLGNVGQGLIRLEFLFGQHDFGRHGIAADDGGIDELKRPGRDDDLVVGSQSDGLMGLQPRAVEPRARLAPQIHQRPHVMRPTPPVFDPGMLPGHRVIAGEFERGG